MRFLNPQAFYAFIIPLLLVPLIIRKIVRDRKAYSVFAGDGNDSFWNRQTLISLFSSLAAFWALVCFIMALSRPVWNPQPMEVEERGQDFVFVLDTSKSMLAEDSIPDRFERSRQEILRVVQEGGGNRYGLIAFAGTPVLRSPLTRDYAFIEKSLLLLNTQYSVSMGGSDIGQALDFAVRTCLDESTSASKAIILITDGEDQGDLPKDVLKTIREKDIRLVLIGVGSKGTGVPIPDPAQPGGFIQYRGQTVKTSLNADYLQSMADEGGHLATYFEAGTASFDLNHIVRELEAEGRYGTSTSKTEMDYTEGFVYFLLPGVLFFCLYLLIPLSAAIRKKEEK